MDDYLAHYGVVGMKWGVRRYQNPDGTLTEKGRKHIARSEELMRLLDKKASKYQEKANKLYYKSDKNKYGALGSKKRAEKLNERGNKAQYRSNKVLRKANKFYESLVNETSNLSVDYISSGTKSLAIDFVKREIASSQMRYNR